MGQKAVSAYETEKFEGKVEREIRKYHKDGGMVAEVVKEDAGYMVYFPKGHSIRVRTLTELKRLGFDEPPIGVDLETGDVYDDHAHRKGTVKEAVRRSTIKKEVPAIVSEALDDATKS